MTGRIAFSNIRGDFSLLPVGWGGQDDPPEIQDLKKYLGSFGSWGDRNRSGNDLRQGACQFSASGSPSGRYDGM